MGVTQLVKQNNEKRALLTEENESYYTDLLVYVRLQWRLSEREIEEVLLEMLDHLLDGQKEDKTAAEMFGEDPLEFADRLIEEISPEKVFHKAYFLVGLATLLLGLILVVRGIVLYIFSFFTEVNSDVNIFQASFITVLFVGFITLVIMVIIRTLKQDLFQDGERSGMKSAHKVGLTAGLSMALLLVGVKFTPTIGPSFTFSAFLSISIGLLLLLIYYGVKKLSKLS